MSSRRRATGSPDEKDQGLLCGTCVVNRKRQTERERECVWKLCVKVSRPDGRTPVSAFEDHTNWAAVDEHLLYPEHIFAQHVRRPIRLAATMNEDGNQSSQRAFKELVDDPVSSR